MREVKMGAYTRGEKTYNFNFYTDISAYDKLKFVNSVVETLVGENYYNYIVKDLIFDFNVIETFTDVDTSFARVLDDEGEPINPINFIEEFLEETNIVEIVKANAKSNLFDELNEAVNKSIAYRTGIHPNPLNDSLTKLINTIEKKLNEIDLDSMMEMASKFSEMTDELTLDNIVNAYMASDTHKNNLVEIEEAEKNRAEFAEDMDKAITAVKGNKKTKK